MQALLIHSHESMLRRRNESGGSGFGCFIALVVIGAVIYFVMKGRRDKEEVLGASKRPMGSGSIAPQTFANPFPKCPNCAAAGDKMKQQWDGLRKVTWTCGYCGNVQIQELKDEELPASARERLGLGGSAASMGPQGYYPPQQGGMGGVGGLLTGMMIGNMLGGSHHDRDSSGWGGGDSGSSGGDWGDSSGDSGGDSGGDWGDSGGGDSGGSDW
ncbi:MAG: hypothetical protein WAT51_06010 [Holophaga sp.]